MSSVQRDKTITTSLSSFSKEQIIAAALKTAVDLDIPIAVWRMPDQNEIQLVMSADAAISLDAIDLDELGSGFVTAPFHFDEQPALFIEAQFSLCFDFDEVINVSKIEGQESEKLQVLRSKFESYLSESVKAHAYHINPKKSKNIDSDYRDLIEKSVKAINSNLFDKVVPARSKEIDLSENFSPVDLLVDLCENYPNAFVSFISIPNIGTWIGATPEILIENKKDRFKTIALAGTQKVNTFKSISDTTWTQKEIEEQAMVSRYIINCFKKIRLREFEEAGPKTVQAGNLLHLKTVYSVDTSATNFPELATVMLKLLHPTSAVAGMPKASALSFLKELEGLDREFFSGFLGPINMENSTNLFVNLRCLQLLGSKARLYAGAGVTSDSHPEKEYQETEIKFKTLLNILNPEP